jgi:hypothetical protein
MDRLDCAGSEVDMKEIVITFGDDGSFNIEAQGFEDASCLDALKDIEKEFGNAESTKLKPEARIRSKNKGINRA